MYAPPLTDPHNPYTQADAALATGAEGTHASPKSGGGGTNVTIQARLSSSSSSPKAAAQEGEKGPQGQQWQQQAEMSRHGTGGEGKKAPPARAGTLHEGEDDEEVDGVGFEEEEETEEDRKYDHVELEETDCPLCHFMRASACGPTWGRWERCIHYHKEKEEDFVGPCARVTLRLARCIEAHKASFPLVLRNALLGGGDDKGVDDEIAEDGEVEQAQQAQQAEAEGEAAPETAAAVAATTGAAAAAGGKE